MELKPAFAACSAFWLDEQGLASSVCHSPRCHSSIAVSCTGGPWGISLGVAEWPTDRARAKNRQVSDTYQTNRPWMREEEEEERDRPTFPSLKGTHPAHYPGFALQCFTVMIHTLFSVCFAVEVSKVKTRPVAMLNKSDLPKLRTSKPIIRFDKCARPPTQCSQLKCAGAESSGRCRLMSVLTLRKEGKPMP